MIIKLRTLKKEEFLADILDIKWNTILQYVNFPFDKHMPLQKISTKKNLKTTAQTVDYHLNTKSIVKRDKILKKKSNVKLQKKK